MIQVSPATGIIRPDHIVEVSVHHEEFQTLEEFVDGVVQNSWCEDSRDKEAILIVKVHGNYTIQTRNHRVRVHHCYSSKKNQLTDPQSNGSRHVQGSVLHRSDFQRLSSSFDVVEQLHKLHSP
ncbi:type II inositol 145-trisphosphate 5-phosphatase FRA3-like [Trifolium medium]|uniref:Type II inositol 145-trisphosphate 5-phosphatase FRA3-like n=1 Tax=Trifolium medium TaxID=97028 RepID=A0A392PN20_9FABA|nr:type II inositol 145-trisphosphate 5-phosphatase FRA3-like [Trifolium medium]